MVDEETRSLALAYLVGEVAKTIEGIVVETHNGICLADGIDGSIVLAFFGFLVVPLKHKTVIDAFDETEVVAWTVVEDQSRLLAFRAQIAAHSNCRTNCVSIRRHVGRDYEPAMCIYELLYLTDEFCREYS